MKAGGKTGRSTLFRCCYSCPAPLSFKLTDESRRPIRATCEYARLRGDGLGTSNPSPAAGAAIRTAKQTFAARRRGSSCQTPVNVAGFSLSTNYRVSPYRYLVQRSISPTKTGSFSTTPFEQRHSLIGGQVWDGHRTGLCRRNAPVARTGRAVARASRTRANDRSHGMENGGPAPLSARSRSCGGGRASSRAFSARRRCARRLPAGSAMHRRFPPARSAR